MSLQPLLDAPWVIQVHAFSAMAGFLLGVIQFAAPTTDAPSIVTDYLVNDYFDRTAPTVNYEKTRAQGYIDAKAEGDTATMEALAVKPTVDEILAQD